MLKKLSVVLVVLVLASMVLAACGGNGTPAATTKIKVCQVTDTGGRY